MKIKLLAAAMTLGLGVLGWNQSASADPITMIYTGSAGSGTLAGNPFGPSMFTFTALADTSNRASCGGSCLEIDHDSLTINISGIGNLTALSATRTFSSSGVGLSRSASTDLYGGSLASGWDMLTSIGPVAGPMFLVQWSDAPQINTDMGILIFDDAEASATFQAIVRQVPEPGTLTLLGLGLAGLGFARRRKSA